MTRQEDELSAIVQKTVPGNKNGPYTVAVWQPEGKGDTFVTFSLSGDVWQESSDPISGEYVILSGLRKMRNGWRATRARRPSIMED